MISTTIRDLREFAFASSWSQAIQIVALVAAACLLGGLIATEHWLLAAGTLGLFFLVIRPIEVAFGLYAFLIPFESITTIGNSSGPTATLLRYVGLLALFVILSVSWLRRRTLRPPRTALFWSLFILWGTVTTLWAIDQTMALKRIPTALGLWLLYMAVVSVRLSKKELSLIILLTILGGYGVSLYSTYLFFRMGSAIGRISLAEGSTSSDPNFFAITLLLPLSLSFGQVLSSRTWPRRALFLLISGAIAFAVFLTMSRGALAAVVVIMFVFLLRLRLNWYLLLPVLIAATALIFMPRLFFERLQDVPIGRLSGRQDIWQIGIHSLKRYGAFGAGLDNFSNAFEQYAGTSRFFAGDQRASHNIYLAASVEFGIVGILFLFEAVRTHMRAFPHTRRNVLASSRLVAFEAACWAMLVAGFGLDILWRKAFWFVWAISIAALHVSNDEDSVLRPYFIA